MYKSIGEWISSHLPDAVAIIGGAEEYPEIGGSVKFYRVGRGTVVVAELAGLPNSGEGGRGILGFHIHSGSSCRGNPTDPFADALTHYNPTDAQHPYHAGDLPPLFVSSRGSAFLAVFTDRFTPKEVLGRVVVIHDSRDDFTTGPGGDSGKKIACGEIVAVRR